MVAFPVRNSNPYFETNAANWTAFGGSAVRSTAQFHQGVASLLLTPDGVTAVSRVETEKCPDAAEGQVWRAETWVRCAATRTIYININWFDTAGNYTVSSPGSSVAATAGVWTQLSTEAAVPAGSTQASASINMDGTPSAATLLYVDEAFIGPVQALVATPQPGNNPPRVLLELTYAGQTSAVVVRNDPDGTTTPVRLAEPAALDGSGQWVGYDYESWFGSAMTYTATTGAGSGSSSSVSLDVDVVWLRHPGVPSLSQQVDFQGEGEPVRAVSQAVMEPLGRSTPIVVSDGQRKSKRGELTLRTWNDTDHAALLGLLDDVTPLLLDVPPGKNFGSDLTHQYLSIGDLTQRRLRPDFYPYPARIWTAPFIVVGRPAGGIVSQRTYSDVLTDFATYQAVRARYTTYTNVLTGA